MNHIHDITVLIDLQKIIVEMQIIVAKARQGGMGEDKLVASVQRIDRLLKIYDDFGKTYTSANFYSQKCLKLEAEIMTFNNILLEKQKEIERLTATLEWQK